MIKTTPQIGCSLKSCWYQSFLTEKQPVDWLEVHAENYFCGGLHRQKLYDVSRLYSLSLHAIGLSLGAASPVNIIHVKKLKQLADEVGAIQISDHASWSRSGNAHFNDLLPLPYTQTSLEWLCRNVDTVQQITGRCLAVENPSTYIEWEESHWGEAEFLMKLVERTGCQLLLDINNIDVQSFNHGLDPIQYLDVIEASAVAEIHLAGGTLTDNQALMIDDHSSPPNESVWQLYQKTIGRFGCKPTIIEWDTDLPELSTILALVTKARQVQQDHLDINIMTEKRFAYA